MFIHIHFLQSIKMLLSKKVFPMHYLAIFRIRAYLCYNFTVWMFTNIFLYEINICCPKRFTEMRVKNGHE